MGYWVSQACPLVSEMQTTRCTAKGRTVTCSRDLSPARLGIIDVISTPSILLTSTSTRDSGRVPLALERVLGLTGYSRSLDYRL